MVARAGPWAGYAGLAALGLALRWAIGLRDLDIVDRWFIQDDAYYTLSIARSLAQGLGPRADPQVLTTGFQPLLAFLEMPLFWITASLDAPLRIALLGLGAIDVALALLIGRMVQRAADLRAGLLACAAWLLSPRAIGLALGGLETTLALFLLVASAELWWRYRRKATLRGAVALGGCIGLTLLARIDTAFLVALIGLYELRYGERRGLAAIVASASLTVAPWWLYCFALSGSIVPESGPAVRELAFIYQGDEVVYRAWRWIAACALAIAVLDLTALSHRMFESSAGALGALVIWAAYGPLSRAALQRVPPEQRAPLGALALHGGLLAVFYATYVPVVWFFPRYLAGTQLWLCVLFALAVARVMGSPSATLRRAGAAAAVVVLLCAGAQSVQRLVSEPDLVPHWAIEGPTGYRRPTRAALAQLPAGAVVGALQTGALGYYAGDATEVVNLDGVVSAPAAAAFARREILAYATARGVTHFCDWPLQHEILRMLGGSAVELRLLWQSDDLQQSGHRVQLSELGRGATAPAAAP